MRFKMGCGHNGPRAKLAARILALEAEVTELKGENRVLRSRVAHADNSVAMYRSSNRRLMSQSLWDWMKSHVLGKETVNAEQA